jgi:SAM-dependent methyltransferase
MNASSRRLAACAFVAVAVGGLLATWRRGVRAGAHGTKIADLAEDAVAAAACVLACPHCHGPLDHATSGTFRCPTCARSYPVRDGIVHLVDPGALGPLDRRFAHLYDWFSWFYPAFTRAGFALIGTSEGRGRREVLDRLDPRGGRVLEVSVGPGSNLPYLIDRPDVGEIHALDISLGQLRRCRALVRRHGWRVPLYLASAEALPFQDATFDAVLHIGGINFFDDKAAALAEMARVAKPGVRVVVVDENERGARSYERTLPGFRATFHGDRPTVSAPVADVPAGMRQVSVSDVWRGWFYCLEFVTPSPGTGPASGAEPEGRE